MYEKNGEKYFIVDAHVHLWDGRESNQRNIHGKQFIDCFYDYHRNLSPEEQVWDYDTYCYYGADRLMQDLFVDGPADHAIFQATILKRQRLRSGRRLTQACAGQPRQAHLQPRLRPARWRRRSGPAPTRRGDDGPQGRQAVYR